MSVILTIIFGAGIFLSVLWAVFLKLDEPETFKKHWKSFFLIPLVFVGLLLVKESYNKVNEGEVAVVTTFGKASDNTLGAGVHFLMPWSSLERFSTRETLYNFKSGGDQNRSGLNAISMQTDGGGSFILEGRVRTRLTQDKVLDLWRQLGSNPDETIIAVSRGCFRGSSLDMQLIEAVTSRRSEIGTRTEACLAENLTEKYGVEVVSVELGDMRLPDEVQAGIDRKQASVQANQQASIDLQTAKIEADVTREVALGAADSEQILRCGAVENSEGKIVPNSGTDCDEERFSQSFLDWLFITNMDKIDSLTIIDPRLVEDGNALIQID